MRAVMLGVTLVFIALFTLLSINELVLHGFTVLSALSLLILALLGVGILGALFNPPGD